MSGRKATKKVAVADEKAANLALQCRLKTL